MRTSDTNGLRIVNLGEARAARAALQQFVAVTDLVTATPVAEFKRETVAEQHVAARQFARSSGGGELDNAIAHWSRGVSGGDDVLERLRADRAIIGDGIAPRPIMDLRAHVKDAERMLGESIAHARPSMGRLAVVGAGLGVVALATYEFVLHPNR